MRTIVQDSFSDHTHELLALARQGAIFFYPTDTIYGLGGIVSDSVIDRINQIKQRPEGKRYSVIAPSFSWIEEECSVDDAEAIWQSLQARYAGGLTVLLPLRAESYLRQRYPHGTLGVRVIDHPFQQFVEELGEPFVTTSANLSGGEPVGQVSDLGVFQQAFIDLAIDAGKIVGKASTVVDWENGRVMR